MVDEKPNEQKTPVKFYGLEDEMAVTTPNGGVIYNPFQYEYLSRATRPAISPGIFATPPPTGDQKENDPNATVLLSPEFQANLFPVEIKEHNDAQSKLLQSLDSQCTAQVQQGVKNFFSNNIIAPSPDVLAAHFRSGINRTSSVLSRPLNHIMNVQSDFDEDAASLYNVSTQTSLSINPDFDLAYLLETVLRDERCAKIIEQETGIGLTAIACQEDEDQPILFDEDSVDRQPVPTNKAHTTPIYTWRQHRPSILDSSFSRDAVLDEDSQSTVVGSEFDLTANPTVMAHSSHVRGIQSTRKRSTDSNDSYRSALLADEAAAIHLSMSAANEPLPRKRSSMPPELELEDHDRSSSGATKRKNLIEPPIATDAHMDCASGPTTPVKDSAYHCVSPMTWDLSGRRRASLQSPTQFHRNPAFRSPCVSPIQPASSREYGILSNINRRTTAFRSPCVSPILPSSSQDRGLLNHPSVRLFGDRVRAVSPILCVYSADEDRLKRPSDKETP